MLSALVCIFAHPLMHIFVQAGETEVLAAGVRYLRVEGAFYAGIGCLFLLYGFYRAVKRPGMSVVLTVISLGTRVALAYALAGTLGEVGIWAAIPIGWALADLTGLRSGTLTVGVIPTFLDTLVPSAVAAFHLKYPGVNVVVRNLLAGPVEEQLVAGQIDVGISFHPTERQEIENEHLFSERMQLVVQRGHPLARRRSLPLQALATVPLAMLPRAFATRRLIDDALRNADVVPSVRVQMESVEALIDACRWGDLASIVPERAARRATDLQVISLHAPQIVRQAGILWRRGASRSTAALEFAALLKTKV